MIFVTIGTQQQSFERLFRYLNQLDFDEELIIQKGKNTFAFRDDYQVYDYLSYEEMEKYFKKARVIITHGGGGTIFKALKMGKRVIVVPRLREYGEHINDHQLEIAQYLENNNLCLVARNFEEFKNSLENIDSVVFSKYVSSENKFIKNVNKEIDKLLGE